MIYLTNSAVQYAVNICSELEGYKVVIACGEEKRRRVFEKMLSIIADDDDIEKVRVRIDSLIFNNGSTIRLIGASESSRCIKTNLLIVDVDIEDEILRQILLPMEVLDWYRYRYSDKTSLSKQEVELFNHLLSIEPNDTDDAVRKAGSQSTHA